MSALGRPGEGANLIELAVFLALACFTRISGLVLIANVGVFVVIDALRATPRRPIIGQIAALAPGLGVAAAMCAAIWLGRDEGTFSYLSGEQGTYEHVSGGLLLRRWGGEWPSNLFEVPARLFGVLFGVGSRMAPGIFVFAFVAIGAAWWWRRGQRFAVVYVLSSLAVTCATTEPQTRYFVPLLPFIFLFGIEGTLAAGGWADAAILRAARGSRIASPMRAAIRLGAAGALALVLLANSFQVGSVIALNFGGDFYHRYQKGEYAYYLPLARDLAANPPPGVVMAREHRVIFALSAVTTTPPYGKPQAGGSDLAGLAVYVRDRSVAAIVVDPRHVESARDFSEFIRSGPFRWRLTANYGTLEVYSREP